jgi:hypothetical protein
MVLGRGPQREVPADAPRVLATARRNLR